MNHGNFKHLYLYCSIFSQLPFILQGRRHAKAEKNTWIKWEPWHLLKWPRTCNLRGKNIGRRLFCCSICHTVTVGSLCFVFQFLQWKLQLITYSGIIKKNISWIIHQYKKLDELEMLSYVLKKESTYQEKLFWPFFVSDMLQLWINGSFQFFGYRVNSKALLINEYKFNDRAVFIPHRIVREAFPKTTQHLTKYLKVEISEAILLLSGDKLNGSSL